MTKKDKELLLKDLCARLPYGVQGITSEGVISPLITKGEADWDILTSLNYRIVKHGWKPYLRPMDSMTDVEFFIYKNTDFVNKLGFCLKGHWDFHELIPKGLALEAPEDMYNI